MLPIAQPPIENGAVTVSNGRITAVGRWPELRSAAGNVVDTGDCALLPGLINAHCHLDYTDMAGQLPVTASFSNWIKSIVALKSEWSYTEFAQSWLHGTRMLLRSGTTTVVDFEAVPELVPDLAVTTLLRTISCFELISLKTQQSAAMLASDAAAKVSGWPTDGHGLAPHAPYTTRPAVLRTAATQARERGWVLTTHVAESIEEFEMFAHARGAMFEWLRTQRDMSDCGYATPVRHLESAGVLGPDLLAAHANYVTTDDIALLARNGVHVVHCPRSHAYFAHQPFPFDDMRRAGINICLGTDSLATVRYSSAPALELDLFAEMQGFARSFPLVSPEEILQMVTVNAANALRRSGQLGVLHEGAAADIIAVPVSSNNVNEAVVHHKGPVSSSIIRGHWAIDPAESE